MPCFVQFLHKGGRSHREDDAWGCGTDVGLRACCISGSCGCIVDMLPLFPGTLGDLCHYWLEIFASVG